MAKADEGRARVAQSVLTAAAQVFVTAFEGPAVNKTAGITAAGSAPKRSRLAVGDVVNPASRDSSVRDGSAKINSTLFIMSADGRFTPTHDPVLQESLTRFTRAYNEGGDVRSSKRALLSHTMQ